MDKVEIRNCKTEYAASIHPMIFVNGIQLDKFLVEELNENRILGLVPSFTWLDDDQELEIALKSFSYDNVGTVQVPFLICPDDSDFSCTTLIIEVEIGEENVIWKRFGFDSSELNKVGSKIEWVEKNIVLKFDKIAYYEFRNKLIELAHET